MTLVMHNRECMPELASLCMTADVCINRPVLAMHAPFGWAGRGVKTHWGSGNAPNCSKFAVGRPKSDQHSLEHAKICSKFLSALPRCVLNLDADITRCHSKTSLRTRDAYWEWCNEPWMLPCSTHARFEIAMQIP